MIVATYARVSTAEQADTGTSLADQERRCIEFAQRHGWRVPEAHRYRDDASGATPHLERAGFGAAWRALAAGDIDALLVLNMDRLGRDDYASSLAVIGKSREYGEGIILLDDDPAQRDSDTAIMRRGMEAVIAAVERRKIRERTERGKCAVWRRGELGAGSPPFGVRWDAEVREWGAIESEAAIVRQVFERYTVLNGFAAVAEWLNEHGIPPPAAGNPKRRHPAAKSTSPRWHPASVGYLIRNPAYRGAYPAMGGRFVIAAPGADTSDWPDAEIVERGDFPVIVPPDLWHRAQAVRRTRRQTTRKWQTDRDRAGLFQGRITCGRCGLRYRIRRGRGRRVAYYCRGRDKITVQRNQIPERCNQPRRLLAADLEALGLDVMVRVFGDPEAFRANVRTYLDGLDAKIAGLERQLAPALAGRAELERRTARLARLYEDGMIGDAEYGAKRDALRAELDRSREGTADREAKLAELERLYDQRPAVAALLDWGAENGVLTAAMSALLELDVLPVDPSPESFARIGAGLRAALGRFVVRANLQVTVHDDGLEVTGQLPGGPGGWGVVLGADEVSSCSRASFVLPFSVRY